MATVTVKHHASGGPADPSALVDGPTYDNDPHIVTGLENVNNTSDLNKPVPTALAITLEQFGGGTGIADNKAALDAAIASTGTTAVRILLGSGIYNFTTTPALIAKNNVIIEGSGEDVTILKWSSGTLLEVNGGFGITQGFQLRNLTLYAPDTVNAKTALKLVDNSQATIENVKVIGGLGSNSLLSGSGGCHGIYSQGREFLRTKNVTVYADIPVRLGRNPNHYGAADHYHLEDMFLVGGTVYPLIMVDPGAVIGNLTLNGTSFNLGTDGFYFNDTAAVNAVTAINNGGTGYHAGDVITLAGGTFSTAIQIRVLAVSAGVITNASVLNPGIYTVLPAYPASQGSTTGTGTGATFTLALAANSIMKIADCRFEQGTSAASSSIFISPAAGFDNIEISRVGLGGDRKGVYLRKTKHTTLELVKFTPIGATLAVDADTSNECLVLENCYWITGSTDNITLPYVNKSTIPTGESGGTNLAPFAVFSNTMGAWNFQAVTVKSTSANALAVGPNGTTNPALQVDASIGSAATGLKLTSEPAAAGIFLTAISSGANEPFFIDSKGSSSLVLNSSASGNVVISAPLSYGGVVLSNSATGTGSMVLSASPTITGAPLAPTAALGTNTTQLATTAFVQAAKPYFSASLSANQSISNNTATKINLNTELADSNNWYDNVTNFRYTPQIAGKQKINGSFAITATTITEVDIYIYKNGSLYARQFSVSSAVGALSLDIGNIVSFNGTTDYVELWCLAVGTGTINVLGSAGGISTWFEAQYLGA